MTENQLSELWNKVYCYIEGAAESYGIYPDDTAEFVVDAIKEITGEE